MLLDRRQLLAALAGSVAVCSSGAIAQCISSKPRYDGKLLLEPQPGNFYSKLIEPYSYVDRCGKKWSVPAAATTDGASIPRFLWSVVGPPMGSDYFNAAVIHDWFCAVRTETDNATHEMFYEAMLSSGISIWRAKTLYWGVCLGGPTWDPLTIMNNRLATGNGKSDSGKVAPAFRANVDEARAAERARSLLYDFEHWTGATEPVVEKIAQNDRLALELETKQLPWQPRYLNAWVPPPPKPIV